MPRWLAECRIGAAANDNTILLIPNLFNVGQESVVCSHALRGGDWVWLA
jgi:hypothetical protein